MSQARSLIGSTLFGIAMTLGLHYYNGMITGVAIQTIMAPITLAENPLVKAVLIGHGIREQDKIFEEKTASELTADDEIIDDKGSPVVRNLTNNDGKATNNSLETILLDTWGAGVKADLTELKAALTKNNCNYQTTEDSWTPLMIMAGLCVPGCASVIRQLKELGANPAMTDKEGWTACHWAAFHGNLEAATELRFETEQLTVKDKDGNTPIETARKEKNDEVAKLFEEALAENKKTK